MRLGSLSSMVSRVRAALRILDRTICGSSSSSSSSSKNKTGRKCQFYKWLAVRRECSDTMMLMGCGVCRRGEGVEAQAPNTLCCAVLY